MCTREVGGDTPVNVTEAGAAKASSVLPSVARSATVTRAGFDHKCQSSEIESEAESKHGQELGGSGNEMKSVSTHTKVRLKLSRHFAWNPKTKQKPEALRCQAYVDT